MAGIGTIPDPLLHTLPCWGIVRSLFGRQQHSARWDLRDVPDASKWGYPWPRHPLHQRRRRETLAFPMGRPQVFPPRCPGNGKWPEIDGTNVQCCLAIDRRGSSPCRISAGTLTVHCHKYGAMRRHHKLSRRGRRHRSFIALSAVFSTGLWVLLGQRTTMVGTLQHQSGISTERHAASRRSRSIHLFMCPAAPRIFYAFWAKGIARGGGLQRAMSNGYRARIYPRDTGIWSSPSFSVHCIDSLQI